MLNRPPNATVVPIIEAVGNVRLVGQVRVAVDVTPMLNGQTGVARYAHNLVSRLAAEGADPRMFAVGRGSGTLPDAARRLRVPLRIVQQAWLRGLPPRAENLAGATDVVHSLDLIPPSTRRPLVATVHDVAALDRPDLHPPRSTAQQQRQIDSLHRASTVVAVSRATAQALGRHGYPASHVAVTHLASTLPDRPPGLSTRGSDGRFLLAVGELAARKDYPTLIRAFAAADLENLRLVIAGPMGYRGEEVPETIRQLDIDDRVTLLGRVTDDQLVTLYRTATALCLPSVIEGFGLPLVEAMQSGLPIVASDIDVVREITDGAAVLAPPGDVDRFAAAITEITDNTSLQSELSAKGQRRGHDFSWETTAAQTVTAYRQAMEAS
jgi:glycosyltransferase involved in cell wall biosynthesis